MKVELVYKSIDESGRQVLKARLQDGTDDVIRHVDDLRYVGCQQITDNDIHDAYAEYSRTHN